MRILFLSWRDLSHPQAGGSEYVVDRLARGMVERGHDVALICARGRADEHAPEATPGAPTAGPGPGYPVFRRGGTYTQYLWAPGTARRHFPDADVLVDVENGIPFFSPAWRRRPVVCLVHHVHLDQWQQYFPRPIAATGRFLEQRVMPRAYRRSLFVAVSPSTAGALAELGIPSARVRTIEMGCDPRPVVAPRSPTPMFVALGRLVAHKRIDLLLELWERVRPVTGGKLVVVGDGPDAATLARRGGEGVEFVGAVGEADKNRLLCESWLLVHPAHHEGWGTVIMEAASLGTPTLGFDVPGVRDSVVDGSTGILAADPDGFVQGWLDIAGDPALRTRLGDGARARSALFTWDRAVESFAHVIDEAVAGSGAEPGCDSMAPPEGDDGRAEGR